MSHNFNIFGNKHKEDDESYPIFSKQGVTNNLGKILIVVILLLSYIQLHYEYDEHLVNIARLKRERNEMRYTSIGKWGKLTQENRPETIKEKVGQSKVQLKECNEPPIKVE